MPCLCPLDAWPAPPGAADKRPVFSPARSYAGAKPMRIPCGQCLSCRLSRSQDWATRIMHEVQCHEFAWFLTPTYSDDHLPADMSVSVRAHQDFVRRLRGELGALRFFGVGEYGGRFGRPHYHTIIFGPEIPARSLLRKSHSGELLYSSPVLERAWPYGECAIGNVTVQSAGYVARYTVKKVGGDAAEERYRRVHPVTGEVCQVRPEFAVMSRRPGIGSAWFERFSADAFPSDFVIVDGRKRPVPRFYKERLDERAQLRVTAKRKAKARRHAADQTDARLLVRDEALRLRAARLKRGLDEGGEA